MGHSMCVALTASAFNPPENDYQLHYLYVDSEIFTLLLVETVEI